MILHDTIGPALDYMAISAAMNVAEAMEEGKHKVEAYAKYNAPWADRTGAAREGLTAEVSVELDEVTLTLFHTVDYGEWLETIQDGQFAIIMPTLEALGAEIVRDAGGKVIEIGSSF